MVLYFTSWKKIGVSSDAFTDLQEIVNSNVQVLRDANNENITEVITKVYKYRIYIYDSIENKSSKNPILNKLNLFFIQMNCILTDWTQYRLSIYVNRFSLWLFYYLEVEYKYTDIFKSDNKNHVDDLTYIAKYVARFVNILQNFLDIAGPHYDTSLLKTLVSLQLKIEYILSFLNAIEQSKFQMLDEIIVHIVLKIMMAIQNFKITNCPLQFESLNEYSFDTEEKQQHYGFSIPNNPLIENIIDDYLITLKDFRINTSLICHVKNTLLETLVTHTYQSPDIADVVLQNF